MRVRSFLLPLVMALALAGGAVVAAHGEGADSYVVAPGDNLTTIALRFATTVDELMSLNGLRNPDRIRIGQQLLVPWHSAATPAVAEGAGVHVVAAGDTLEDIALAYGLTVADLTEANRLVDPDFLRIGERLTVPAPSLSTARAAWRYEVDPSWLAVPYRSQFDGTTWADSNCGPATLGMLMAYYDEWWSSDGVRRDVNQHTGDWSLDGGSSWESLVYAAQKRGFTVEGLYEGQSYRRWTFDQLIAAVENGRPPALLVRFRNLPGHRDSSWWGDHYIIVVGWTADGQIVYHDSAFWGDDGAYRTMSEEQLMRAWSTNIAGIQYSAMVLRWHGRGG